MISVVNMDIPTFEGLWDHAKIQRPNGIIFIRLIGEHGSYVYANSYEFYKGSKEFVTLYIRDFRNNIDIPVAMLNLNDIDNIYSPWDDEI